jgi:hypothetical protein
MPTILFADGFLTGSLLSLLLPVGLLIAVVVGFIMALRRLPGSTEDSVSAPAEQTASPHRPSGRGASAE